jgi:hypothetical protein
MAAAGQEKQLAGAIVVAGVSDLELLGFQRREMEVAAL